MGEIPFFTPQIPEIQREDNSHSIFSSLFESARIISGSEQKITIQKGQELEDLLRILLDRKLSDPNLTQKEKDEILTHAKREFSRLIAETRPDILIFAALKECPEKIDELTQAPRALSRQTIVTTTVALEHLDELANAIATELEREKGWDKSQHEYNVQLVRRTLLLRVKQLQQQKKTQPSESTKSEIEKQKRSSAESRSQILINLESRIEKEELAKIMSQELIRTVSQFQEEIKKINLEDKSSEESQNLQIILSLSRYEEEFKIILEYLAEKLSLPPTKETIIEEIKSKALVEGWDLFDYYQKIINYHSSKRLALGYHYPEMLRWICLSQEKNPNRDKIKTIDEMNNYFGINLESLSNQGRKDYQEYLLPAIQDFQRAILQADEKRIKKTQKRLISALKQFYQTHHIAQEENAEELVNHLLIGVQHYSNEELQNLAFSEKWDLERSFPYYCQYLRSIGKKPPSLPKETDIIYYQNWIKYQLTKEQKERLKNTGGILGINDVTKLAFQAVFKFITQPEAQSEINALNPLSETTLRLDDYSIIQYFEKLQNVLIPIEELLTDEKHDEKLPMAQSLIKKRINHLSHRVIDLILALSNFGIINLSKKEKETLLSIPRDINLADGFNYDKELDPVFGGVFLEKGVEKKRRKALLRKRKRWFNIVKKILYQLRGQNLPLVISLPNEDPESIFSLKFQKWGEEWEERLRRFKRTRRMITAALIASPIISALGLSRIPIVRTGVPELVNAGQIAYAKILEEAHTSPPSNFIEKLEWLSHIRQILPEAEEETLFKFGTDFLGRYATKISGSYFSELNISQESSSTPLLTEKDFIHRGEPPPQTLIDLLTSLETKQGRERMIESLIENFYQLASFKFADEDRFSFISQQNLRTRLEQLINQLKDLLNREADKNKRIDTLNPESKKQEAVSDWQQLIIEILKYYSPQLSSTISLLQPKIEGPLDNPTKYTDLSHEYACKRQGYYFCEEIFYHIASGEKPPIIIHNQQELEDVSSFFFDKQKFIDWLNNPNNHFENEEERWQFASWAITLAEKQIIDLDLISRFVDLNRFFQETLKESGLEENKEALRHGINTALVAGIMRARITRRDYLIASTFAGASLGALALGLRINEEFKSPFEAFEEKILKHYNGEVFEETRRRLSPILTLNPFNPHIIPQALTIKDQEGREIGRYFDANREFIPFSQIPPEIIAFLVAVEDKRFYDHPGVDTVGLARGYIFAGESGGGSTLTQQLIRLLCYSQEELLQERFNPALAYKRKMVEIVAALIFEKKWEDYFFNQIVKESNIDIEEAKSIAKRLTKQKILEIYLNNVPFGPNVYGIKAASKFYFNKEPQELTQMEIAFLIGLIQNPIGYYPFNLSLYDETSEQSLPSGKDTDQGIQLNMLHPAIKRLKENIVPILYEQKIISKDMRDNILESTITLNNPFKESENPYMPFYNQVINHLLTHLSPSQIFSGLEITVTLDKERQKQMEELIKQKLQEQLKNNAQEGAIIILDGETGAILAAAGARKDPQNPEAVIVDNNIPYQENFPGSSVKPFTYAAGLEEGILHENQTLTGNTYRGITNSGGRNYGPVLPPEALSSSLNTAAQQLGDWVGVLKIRYYWNRLKIRLSSFLPLSRISTNITLGTERVRPIDLAGAFTVFTNAGQFSQPTLIQQVSQNGKVVFNLSTSQSPTTPAESETPAAETPTPKNSSTLIFSQQVAQQIVQALGDPKNKIYPSPETWRSLRDSIDHQGRIWYFAKTGTESNPEGAQRAVWCVGGVIDHQTGKKYVVLTYLGTQNSKGMTGNVWGSNVLAPLWRQIAGQLISENPNEDSQNEEQIPTE